MDNLLNKLCEKSEAELWEMVKVEQWTPEHAEVAFYLTEIMKGVKKIEHLKLVQEAMKKAEEMGDAGMEHMMGTEPQMSHYAYARRGGRGGRRGGRGRYNYRYDSEEDESYPMEFAFEGGGGNYGKEEEGWDDYARGGRRGGNNYAQGGRGGSGNYAQGGGGNYAQMAYNYAMDEENYGRRHMRAPYPGYMPKAESVIPSTIDPMMAPVAIPPVDPAHVPAIYSIMPYVENRINEKVEKEWLKAEKELEKEKKEWEKEKNKEKESSGNKMPPPSMK